MSNVCTECDRPIHRRTELGALCTRHEVERAIKTGAYVTVNTRFYGCGSGCTGVATELIKADNTDLIYEWEFRGFYGDKHPDGKTQPCDCDECQFVISYAEGSFPGVKIDWDECNISEL